VTADVRPSRALVGCAGWTIPGPLGGHFPGSGPHLLRYAGRLPVTEINSSFHRPHRPAIYARWASGVGPSFRFAVKVPKEVTHVRRLVDAEEPLERFLEETAALGPRRGPLLVQLPPSLAFDPAVADRFLTMLRARHAGPVVCEPRGPSWFDEAADELLRSYEVARVAADPAPVPAAAVPGGWPGLVYRRLHGSPVTYRSPYEPATLDAVASAMEADLVRGVESWCILDNTASGAAAGDALALVGRLRATAPRAGS
jgi:uncharacterized protein YecE (DUF72 family)